MILDFFDQHTYYAENNQEKSYNYHGHHYNRDSYENNEPFYKNAQYDYKSYEPYLPSYDVLRQDKNRNRYYYDRDRDRNYWGINKNTWGSYGGHYGNNYYDHYPNRNYLPSNPVSSSNKDWGQYGGSYGYGDQNFIYVGYKDSSDYWGLGGHSNANRPSSTYYPSSNGHRPGSYYNTPPNIVKRPEPGITYLPASTSGRNDINQHHNMIPDKHLNPPIRHDDGADQGVHPPFTFDRPGYNFVKDGEKMIVDN